MFIIDHFEPEWAIMDDNTRIPRAYLPRDACEGDILVQYAAQEYRVDAEATRARHQALRSRMENLFK
ncbi:MAG: DUF3006 domain-containing protein [Christensenellaceae bacterium]|jgi:hypothetical protein|nr:DUF3006 domain-containing protein [Christensenellaceae bacterium]